MQVHLPLNALVKKWDTGLETPVADLAVGDKVLMYDLSARTPVVVALEQIASTEPTESLSIMLQHYRWISGFPDTQVQTPKGSMRLDGNIHTFLTACVINPRAVSSKTPIDMFPSKHREGRILTWAGPALLWAEGLLVGN